IFQLLLKEENSFKSTPYCYFIFYQLISSIPDAKEIDLLKIFITNFKLIITIFKQLITINTYHKLSMVYCNNLYCISLIRLLANIHVHIFAKKDAL
ncbi:MAG TPA: hypothetical protein VH396_17195, partial [Chitinophagaceae bacterium]